MQRPRPTRTGPARSVPGVVPRLPGVLVRISAGVALGASVCLGSSGTAHEQDALLVHAASSLRGVCEEFAAVYSEWRPEVILRFNFGASSDLASQLIAGSRGDVFLSADDSQLDRLHGAGLLADSTRCAICSNVLVVVEPVEASLRGPIQLRTAEDLSKLGRISIADPQAVPAGVYARAWLEGIGAWNDLEPLLVPGINARAALAAVEVGACGAGIVYRTDARLSTRVRIAFEIPAEQQPLIRYGGAVLEQSTGDEARAFLDLLRGRTGALVLEQHGFLPLSSRAAGPRPRSGENGSGAWLALWVSLKIAGLATLVVFVPGALLGWLLSRKRFPGHSLVETLVALPLVLPPTAVGYVLLRSFAGDGPLSALNLDLLLTWKGAVIAAAVMSLPLVARTARVAFDGVDPRLESMGASLGWSRLTVLRRVTAPLARRGLMAAGVLGFSRALGEFGATVIVAGNIPGETQTLALAIFQDIQLGRDERAMRLLLISVVIAFLAVWIVEAFLSRERRGARSR